MSIKNLFASLESTDLNDSDVVVTADDTLEEEVFQVTDGAQEVEETTNDVEELEEVAEGLESICVSLEAAIADGGLDPVAARFMHHAVGAYTNRLGLESTDVAASLESFGGASSRAGATTVSLETIKETLQKVWQAIKNAVMKAIAAVKNFFAKIFGGVKKLKERSAALKKSVGELGSKKAKGKIKVPSANSLRFNGKADIKSIETGLANTVTVGKMVTDSMMSGAKVFYSQAAQAITNAQANKEGAESLLQAKLTESRKAFHDTATTITTSSKAMSGDSVYRYESREAVGEEDTKSIPSLKKNAVGKDIAENFEIDAPEASDLNTVLGHVDNILAILDSKKANFDALTKAREEAVSASEKFVGVVASGKIKEGFTNARVSMALRSVNSDLSKPISSFFNFGFNTVRAALALVDRGVAAHA